MASPTVPTRLRVCMFVHNGYVQDARVRKEVRTLVDSGHHVTVLALEDPAVRQGPKLDGATVRYVKRDFFSRRRRPPARSALPDPVEADPSKPAKPAAPSASWVGALHRPIAYRDYNRRCKRIVRSLPADVYHAHDLPTLPVAAYAAKRHNAHLVYDSHELFTEAHGLTSLERLSLRRKERRLAPRATRIITVSESIADELSKRYAVDRPLVLLNCPPKVVTRKGNELRTATGVPADQPLALYVGGLSPDRGLPELLSAVAFLRDLHLAILGNGVLLPNLKQKATELNADRRIHFLPPVPYAELLQWAQGADIGVIPYRATSLNNYYSCPNKLFEYIGAGLAVAASDFPELRRFVKGHELGEVFDPDKPADIARSLQTILADPKRLSQMRTNSRRAADTLNWETESQKLVALYRGLKRRPA